MLGLVGLIDSLCIKQNTNQPRTEGMTPHITVDPRWRELHVRGFQPKPSTSMSYTNRLLQVKFVIEESVVYGSPVWCPLPHGASSAACVSKRHW